MKGPTHSTGLAGILDYIFVISSLFINSGQLHQCSADLSGDPEFSISVDSISYHHMGSPNQHTALLLGDDYLMGGPLRRP